MVSRKTGTFEEFKDYTLAIVRGERAIDPREPTIWAERTEADDLVELPGRKEIWKCIIPRIPAR